MDFVAIDFETANEKRNSPCSLGLTVVMRDQVVLEKYWLICPPELRFAPMNIWVHGIRAADVAHAATFDQLWPEILPYLEGELVVAHNASFDMSVLRATLDTYDIAYPKLTYCCTMQLAKQFYPHLENSKLSTVCHYIGHQFNHHHASSDATACAKILLTIAQEIEATDLTTFAETLGLRIGQLTPSHYTPPKLHYVSQGEKQRPAITPQLPQATLPIDCLKGHVIAFTGPLSTMTRPQAVHLITGLGATYSSSVTRKTTLVVTGARHIADLSPEQMSTKMRRALELIDRGQPIAFLHEEDFLAQLNKLHDHQGGSS